jgi:hypothetical protein
MNENNLTITPPDDWTQLSDARTGKKYFYNVPFKTVSQSKPLKEPETPWFKPIKKINPVNNWKGNGIRMIILFYDYFIL